MNEKKSMSNGGTTLVSKVETTTHWTDTLGVEANTTSGLAELLVIKLVLNKFKLAKSSWLRRFWIHHLSSRDHNKLLSRSYLDTK